MPRPSAAPSTGGASRPRYERAPRRGGEHKGPNQERRGDYKGPTQERREYKGPNRDGVLPPRERWAKDNTKTFRVRDAAKEKEEEQAHKAKYQGNPDEDENELFTLVYLWPEASSPSDMFGGPDLKKLNGIRAKYYVYIREFYGYLEIKTAHGEHVLKLALLEVRTEVRDIKAQTTGAKPLHLAYPPLAKWMSSGFVTPMIRIPMPGQQPGQPSILPLVPAPAGTYQRALSQGPKPIIDCITVSGSRLDKDQAAAWKEKRKRLQSLNEKSLIGYLKTNMNPLRVLKRSLFMRVHFGKLSLVKYKLDILQCQYTFDDFFQMMGKGKVLSTLRKSMGNLTRAKEFKQAIELAPAPPYDPNGVPPTTCTFSPTDNYISDLRAVQPVHSIVVSFTNPSDGPHRLEVVVDDLGQGQRRGQVHDFQPGTSRLHKEDELKYVAINMMGTTTTRPDWCLSVGAHNEVDMPEHMFGTVSIMKLKQTSDDELLVYPVPNIKPIIRSNITEVSVRSMYSYDCELNGETYRVELTVVRTWKGAPQYAIPYSAREPDVTCEVQFYNPHWDESLDPRVFDQARSWDPELRRVFSQRKDPDLEGASKFLKSLGRFQLFLHHVYDPLS